MITLHGIIPYMVSPIDNSTGQVKEKALRNLIEHCIISGVHGISPLGSNGEFSFLSLKQKQEIVRICVDQANNRVPIVAGVSGFSTREVMQQAEAFIQCGAQSLVLILQKMFPLSHKELIIHYQTVCEAFPDTTMVIYTNPEVLNYDFSIDALNELSFLNNLNYIKDASGKTGRLLSMINAFGDRVKIFSASAHIPINVFQLGGVGWMAGPACVAPKEIVKLYDLSMAQKWDEALILQKKLWSLNQIFIRYSLAKCTKAALNLQGFDVGDPILPQLPLDQSAITDIKNVLT